MTKSQQVEKIVTQYINDNQKQQKSFEDFKNFKLSDFGIESLELFEMLIEIEEAIGKEIPDSILSAEVKVGELVDKIVKL